MLITKDQLEHYREEGFLFLPRCFSQNEVNALKAELPAIYSEEGHRKVVEKDGEIVRSVYGCHTRNEMFSRLSRHPRVVQPAIQILGSGVYVYQLKVNAKQAFDGDVWDWHQDFVFWQKEDGMASPRVINAAIFLDEVNEFNGPIFLIPRSHKEGVINGRPSHEVPNDPDLLPETYKDSPSWISNLTATIKYSVDRDVVVRLASQYGIVSAMGASGSMLLFHADIVHASPSNISPFSRAIVFISYNSVENIPSLKADARPDFLVGRDYEAIVPLREDTLAF